MSRLRETFLLPGNRNFIFPSDFLNLDPQKSINIPNLDPHKSIHILHLDPQKCINSLNLDPQMSINILNLDPHKSINILASMQLLQWTLWIHTSTIVTGFPVSQNKKVVVVLNFSNFISAAVYKPN